MMKYTWENLWTPAKLLIISIMVVAMAGVMMLMLVALMEGIFWIAELGAYAT